MGWMRLEPSQGIREKLLQSIFDAWGSHQHLLGGVPPWLRDVRVDKRPFRRGRGYRWQSDVELVTTNGKRWIVELKHADFGEPLALAEVLHHAQALRKTLNEFVQPAIICTYSNWLRMALWHLIELYGKTPVEYCEAQVFEDPPESGRYIIWLDLPFAARRPSGRLPDIVPGALRDADLHWYSVQDTGSFIAARQPLDPEYPFLEGKVMQLTPAGADWLLWLGEEPAGERPSLAGLRHDYFLHTARASSSADVLSEPIHGWLHGG